MNTAVRNTPVTKHTVHKRYNQTNLTNIHFFNHLQIFTQFKFPTLFNPFVFFFKIWTHHFESICKNEYRNSVFLNTTIRYRYSKTKIIPFLNSNLLFSYHQIRSRNLLNQLQTMPNLETCKFEYHWPLSNRSAGCCWPRILPACSMFLSLSKRDLWKLCRYFRTGYGRKNRFLELGRKQAWNGLSHDS